MSNNNSNPMSEYDFAEIPDQNDPEEVLNNVVVQRMDPAILNALQAYNLDQAVLEQFALSKIPYSCLSALDKEDLVQLGITDEELQSEMLAEFKNLEGQEPHLTALLRIFNEPISAVRYETSVIDMFQGHLVKMNTLLAATILKLGITKTLPTPGVVINEKFSSPDAVMEVLQEMSTHVEALMIIVRKLKENGVDEEKKSKYRLKGVAWNGLMVMSGIAIGFCIFKQLGGGNRL